MSKLKIALEQLERDHGDCDDNSCTISVAMRHGFDLVALDHFMSSGRAEDFPKGLKLNQKNLDKQSDRMVRTLPYVDCGHCGSILWCPEECDYLCGNCNKKIDPSVKQSEEEWEFFGYKFQVIELDREEYGVKCIPADGESFWLKKPSIRFETLGGCRGAILMHLETL